jgi:pimeloyl-ACP methyl ester carboxylesterase
MRSAVLLVTATLALVASSGVAAQSHAKDFCLEPGERAVPLRASDGARIYGVAVGKGQTGLVLVHQYGSDHCEFMNLARDLAPLGYRLLVIDLRDNGSSRGGAPGRYDRDVAAAVGWLRANGSTRVKLVGASMGGTAVLVAAATIAPRVDGVVSLSAPAAYYGLDALKAVKRSSVPVRFVVAVSDAPFAADARRLAQAAAAKDKAILRLPGSAHGSSLLEFPRSRSFVVGFLGR